MKYSNLQISWQSHTFHFICYSAKRICGHFMLIITKPSKAPVIENLKFNYQHKNRKCGIKKEVDFRFSAPLYDLKSMYTSCFSFGENEGRVLYVEMCTFCAQHLLPEESFMWAWEKYLCTGFRRPKSCQWQGWTLAARCPPSSRATAPCSRYPSSVVHLRITCFDAALYQIKIIIREKKSKIKIKYSGLKFVFWR